jgi:leader peptidase (prepilin peptidase)/N-methyltransferase
LNPWILLQVFAFVLGLCLGSFLNVCIARMPEDRSIVRPASHCPRCGSFIKWYDNIPVLSWILLRARCRACGQSIAATYPLVELCVGLLALLLWRRILPNEAVLDPPHLLLFAWYLAFVCMLVGLTFIDLRHYIIPDEFSIYAVPLGVLGAVLLGWLAPGLALDWKQSVMGALVGGLILLVIAGFYYLVRKEEGMGFGDVKLLAMIGSFLGAFPGLFMVLMIGSVLGSAVGIAMIVRKGHGFRTALPFGPFLALGALIHLFFGKWILSHLMLGLSFA